jgi:hypothetical protein
MKPFRIVLLVAVVLMFFSQNAYAQDIDLLWKARALKAGENLEKLYKQLDVNDSRKLRFDIVIETAYAGILIAPETLIKTEGGITAYHLFFNFGDDGFLDVVYVYNSSTMKSIGARVDSLPKNRAVLFHKKFPSDLIVISNNEDDMEPALMFSLSDPFIASTIIK